MRCKFRHTIKRAQPRVAGEFAPLRKRLSAPVLAATNAWYTRSRKVSYFIGETVLRMRRLGCLVSCALLAALAAACAESQNAPPPSTTPPATAQPLSEVKPELEKHFQGFVGTFVLYDLHRHQYIRYNPARSDAGFLPASTFKIMNSLVGLETGIIPDENFVIEWDGTPYDLPAWNQDHTLKTAIQNSVVWYYQELARRVGKEKMQELVTAAEYGNQNITGPIDTFWLEGELRISANEQVEFLRRLYEDELPFLSRSVNIVQTILVLDKTEAYQLSGKTGSVTRVAPYVGWFVGYVEKGADVYFFATNIESEGPEANGLKAQEISRNILLELGVLR